MPLNSCLPQPLIDATTVACQPGGRLASARRAPAAAMSGQGEVGFEERYATAGPSSSSRAAGLLPDGVTDQDEPPAHLPRIWHDLFKQGQVLTALLLSTSFSEKYRGRNMWPDTPNNVAEIRLPAFSGSGDAAGGEKTWKPTLLGRCGNREAVAFIWRGDDQDDTGTLYVAFSPLRYKSQFVKVVGAGLATNGLSLRRTAAQTTPANWGAADDTGQELHISVSTYC
ncbi:unnamed protein product [Prorocentrum cordatum]|uniref:Uncharacterized protein n=1 Tax=Prorocentrum cordatum TaxID=2364126 RepID=A0ABN9V1J1_9DINO|nr:unnamed protein product [Polarella glacialis]